jgi:SAM-dependent methyltransferase
MRPGTLLRWYALKKVLKEEVKEKDLIIDIGSYDGFIPYSLKSLLHDLNIVVIELDKEGLQESKGKGLTSLCASGLSIPIKNNSVDMVLCLDVIEHIIEDAAFINEISRVLKKGAKLILTTPMENGITFPLVTKENNQKINMNWGHVRLGYSLENIENLLRNHNLFITKTGCCFNLLSKICYWFAYLSNIPIRGKTLLFRAVLFLEPYVKYGAEDHIIIAEYNKSQI